jgi:hypothetical protein
LIRVTLPEPLDGAEDEAQRNLTDSKTQDEYDTKLGAYMRWYGVPAWVCRSHDSNKCRYYNVSVAYTRTFCPIYQYHVNAQRGTRNNKA